MWLLRPTIIRQRGSTTELATSDIRTRGLTTQPHFDNVVPNHHLLIWLEHRARHHQHSNPWLDYPTIICHHSNMWLLPSPSTKMGEHRARHPRALARSSGSLLLLLCSIAANRRHPCLPQRMLLFESLALLLSHRLPPARHDSRLGQPPAAPIDLHTSHFPAAGSIPSYLALSITPVPAPAPLGLPA